MNQQVIKEAEKHLAQADPILGMLIKSQTLEMPERRNDYFESLCRSIIGQQVSVAAATTIYGRFSEVTKLKPEIVAELDQAKSKTIGLSKQKTSYLKDLATHFVNDPNVYNHLEVLKDEEVIAELIEVRGIGMWTAQMFLLFTLARPDVFAPDDVGLQRAMMNLYGWAVLPPKTELIAVSEKWKPYRSVALLHLWQSLDNKEVL